MNQQPIYAKNGWKYDRDVTVAMIEDMMFDPILAAKVLLGIRIPPHQELRMLRMWTTHFTMDDSGFSTGKSYTYAIISAIRSVLFAGRISGILSGTYRQGKLIFQNYERWVQTSKIFRCSLQSHNGQPRLIHGTDVHMAYFRGGSEIRVLPPNLMQNADRLRSERWNDGYVDEWTIFPNYDAITKTIYGRVSAKNDYGTCYVRGNHLHLASTPQYEHSPSYGLVKMIDANIQKGNKNYARFTSNYRHIPRTKHWNGFADYRTIYGLQTTNPPGMVKSEVDGKWQSDSQSFYLSSEVDNARSTSSTALLKRLNQSDVYIAAFDTARGASKSRQGSRDDFAMSVFRLPDNGHGKPVHVLTVRQSGITAANASGIIHEYHQLFHFAWIMFDPQGGGLFVADELEKPQQIIRGELKNVVPIVKYDDNESAVLGDQILVGFLRRSEFVEKMWGTMQSDSVLVNRMHNLFSEAVRSGSVILATTYDWTTTRVRETDVAGIRKFLNKAGGMTELNRVRAEMDLAVKQLVLVDVLRDAAGQPVMDSHNMYKFKSKEKKDSAYSLAYGYLMCALFQRVVHKRNARPQVGFAASIREM
jgi:hypothetical protein